MRREYLRYQGDKIDYLKKKNPKAFYRFFRKNKRNHMRGPSLSDFYDHFKTMSSAEEEKQSMTDFFFVLQMIVQYTQNLTSQSLQRR
jgi:hypothetical protein